MSIARLKRLQRLEARQPKALPWTDPYPIGARLLVDLEAVVAGKACRRKRPERAEPWSEETQTAFELAVREHDRMHERLTAERR